MSDRGDAGDEMRADTKAHVVELIGVYDADGTLRGELAYWIGARLGRAHCSLCDVTHGTFRERADWRRCRADLPVPFHTFHRDDQPDDVRALTARALPAVVARTSDGPFLLLGPEDLEACAGSPERLVDAIEAAIVTRGLQA